MESRDEVRGERQTSEGLSRSCSCIGSCASPACDSEHYFSACQQEYVLKRTDIKGIKQWWTPQTQALILNEWNMMGKLKIFYLFSWPFSHTSSGWYMELLVTVAMASLIRRILSTPNEGMMISYENQSGAWFATPWRKRDLFLVITVMHLLSPFFKSVLFLALRARNWHYTVYMFTWCFRKGV